ncbi:MAG: hypothetical protein ACT4PU_09290, partial [Planctomycetota bacterium]
LASALGTLAAAAGLGLAVVADLHLESSIVVAAFLLLPLAWLWTLRPVLAIAAGLGLGALAPLLAPEEVAPPGERHSHDALALRPFTLDVHLDARRDAGALTIEWTLDLHRDDPSAALPPAIWLHLDGAGAAGERALIADTSTLSPGDHFLQGRFTTPDLPGAATLHGSLWSGPTTSPEALPIDGAEVADTAIE